MRPSTARLRHLIEFTGWPTIGAVCLLWSFGLILLLLELGFAYLLQHFLSALGLISIQPVGRLSLDLSLNETVLLITAVAVARSAITFAQAVCGGGAVEGFAHRLRSMLVETCLQASSVRSAETLTFFNQRIYTASMSIQSLQTLLLQGTVALGLLCSLFWMGPAPTVLMLLVVAAALLPMRSLNRRGKRSATLHADTFSKIMLHLNNIFRNFLLIRLFNLQERERTRIQGHLKTYSNYIMQYYRIEGLWGALAPLVIALNILWLAFVQNSAAAIERSLAVPYLYLSFRFAQNLAPLVSNASRLAFASTQFGYTFRWWLDRKACQTQTFDTAPPRQEVLPVASAIGWKLYAVTFGYPGQAPLFENFDLEVAPGSLVRVHGASGVGKSTLVRLMTGESSPSSGSVSVQLDGELYAVNSAAARLREHLGYSSTEPYLFEGTIYQNITYGLKALPDEGFLLESVARAECQFVFEFPEKFEHQIDELGQGLSTGQKQRLSLLRALLRKPRALILDEALSNVDARTENRILTNLAIAKRECTVLLISHREHPSLAADAVLNLDESL